MRTVRLLFEEPGAVGVRFGPGFPIGVLNRVGGGRVYVLADPVSVSALTDSEMAAVSDEARCTLPERDLPDKPLRLGGSPRRSAHSGGPQRGLTTHTAQGGARGGRALHLDCRTPWTHDCAYGKVRRARQASSGEARVVPRRLGRRH
jgi:hypothetical protein